MAAQEKQDWNIKDNDAISDLRIHNVEVSDKLLGTGLFGTVNEAAWYGTPCAVKKAHAKFLDSSTCDSFISSLIWEASIWAKLKHPHITLLLGLFQMESSVIPLLVIEKLDSSLHDLLQDCLKGIRQLSLQQKVSILLQVALGLTYLHRLSPPAVHGSLTASNVLIGLSSLTAKITDFGLARAIGSGGRPSLLYSPPEVLEMSTDCEESLPVESDVFSYGVLIINTINHRLLKLLPQRVKHASKKEIVALTEFERRRQDFDCFSSVETLHFEGIIKACLEFFPEYRPNSLALVSNLQEIQDKVRVSHPSRMLSEEGSQLIEGKTGISRAEREILEKEKQLEELLQDLKLREINLKETERKLTEINKTIIAGRTEVHHMSGKVMQVKHLKMERQVQLVPSKELQVYSLSSKNVIEFNGSVFFAVGLKSEDDGVNYRLVKITLEDKETSNFSCEILPSPPVCSDIENCTLVVCHDIIHVLGWSKNTMIGKTEVNILSFSLSENQWKQYLQPPPGSGFTIVSYKDSIFIATAQYPRSNLKMLNLNSHDPVWVEILPMPYSAQSNRNISLLIFGDILVLQNDTLYFTNLSDLLSAYAKDDSCSSLTAQWGTLPPPPRSVLSPFLLVAPNDELLAVDNTECCVGERPMFALNTSTFKWVKIANDMKQTISMCTSLTNNSLFVVHSKDSVYYYMCQ